VVGLVLLEALSTGAAGRSAWEAAGLRVGALAAVVACGNGLASGPSDFVAGGAAMPTSITVGISVGNSVGNG